MKESTMAAASPAVATGLASNATSAAPSQAASEVRANGVDLFLLGDSLTEGWRFNGKVLQESFSKLVTINAGITSDGVQHMVWRVRSGELAAANPRLVIIMAGVNLSSKGPIVE